jgi:SAM-dependent methyltransferase
LSATARIDAACSSAGGLLSLNQIRTSVRFLEQENDMTETTDRHPAPRTTGLLIHAAVRYDFMVWLFTLGRERAFREQILSFANLKIGEAVLDVGCGTGSLAIAAKRHVGPTGTVHGIDASPEMLARAVKKAAKTGREVVFKNGAAQALPFADGQFDAVLSTLMLHTCRERRASNVPANCAGF